MGRISADTKKLVGKAINEISKVHGGSCDHGWSPTWTGTDGDEHELRPLCSDEERVAFILAGRAFSRD